jgi:hypothetical protein
MKDFFKVEKIIVEQGDTEYIFFMSPLKIKHLADIQRIRVSSAHMDEAFNGNVPLGGQVLYELISVLEKVFTPSISDLPMEVLEDLFSYFIEMNFNEDIFTSKGKGEETFTTILDFLISQGHQMSDILEYTLPQLQLFVNAASDRITGGKTKQGDDSEKVIDASDDPLSVFRAIGIPFTSN